MEDVLVPIFGIIFLFGVPVAAWVISRVLAHQERMEMIRHGYMPPPDPRAMRRGTWQGPVPPPPGVGTRMPPMPGYDPSYYAQAQLRKGITLTLIGFALLIGFSFMGGLVHPNGSLLVGLIVMFVGIAQIINAVLNGAHLPGITIGTGQQHQGTTFGPPPGPGPGPDGGPIPPEAPRPGPYAWRPGPTPEIEKPPSPPDFR